MDKRHLHHLWTKVRRVKVWHLLVLCMVAAAVCVFSLRNNNLQMVRLRDGVYAADKNNGNVEQTLQNLRAYVQMHMNTDLASGNTSVYPPIQLKYTYERLQQAEKQRVDATNARIYPDAQVYCEQAFPSGFYGASRLPCIENYITTHSGTKTHAIPDSLYKFSFISPAWSPDLAGWSLVLAVLLLVLAALRLIAGQLARRFL